MEKVDDADDDNKILIIDSIKATPSPVISELPQFDLLQMCRCFMDYGIPMSYIFEAYKGTIRGQVFFLDAKNGWKWSLKKTNDNWSIGQQLTKIIRDYEEAKKIEDEKAKRLEEEEKAKKAKWELEMKKFEELKAKKKEEKVLNKEKEKEEDIELDDDDIKEPRLDKDARTIRKENRKKTKDIALAITSNVNAKGNDVSNVLDAIFKTENPSTQVNVTRDDILNLLSLVKNTKKNDSEMEDETYVNEESANKEIETDEDEDIDLVADTPSKPTKPLRFKKNKDKHKDTRKKDDKNSRKKKKKLSGLFEIDWNLSLMPLLVSIADKKVVDLNLYSVKKNIELWYQDLIVEDQEIIIGYITGVAEYIVDRRKYGSWKEALSSNVHGRYKEPKKTTSWWNLFKFYVWLNAKDKIFNLNPAREISCHSYTPSAAKLLKFKSLSILDEMKYSPLYNTFAQIYNDKYKAIKFEENKSKPVNENIIKITQNNEKTDNKIDRNPNPNTIKDPWNYDKDSKLYRERVKTNKNATINNEITVNNINTNNITTIDEMKTDNNNNNETKIPINDDIDMVDEQEDNDDNENDTEVQAERKKFADEVLKTRLGFKCHTYSMRFLKTKQITRWDASVFQEWMQLPSKSKVFFTNKWLVNKIMMYSETKKALINIADAKDIFTCQKKNDKKSSSRPKKKLENSKDTVFTFPPRKKSKINKKPVIQSTIFDNNNLEAYGETLEKEAHSVLNVSDFEFNDEPHVNSDDSNENSNEDGNFDEEKNIEEEDYDTHSSDLNILTPGFENSFQPPSKPSRATTPTKSATQTTVTTTSTSRNELKLTQIMSYPNLHDIKYQSILNALVEKLHFKDEIGSKYILTGIKNEYNSLFREIKLLISQFHAMKLDAIDCYSSIFRYQNVTIPISTLVDVIKSENQNIYNKFGKHIGYLNEYGMVVDKNNKVLFHKSQVEQIMNYQVHDEKALKKKSNAAPNLDNTNNQQPVIQTETIEDKISGVLQKASTKDTLQNLILSYGFTIPANCKTKAAMKQFFVAELRNMFERQAQNVDENANNTREANANNNQEVDANNSREANANINREANANNNGQPIANNNGQQNANNNRQPNANNNRQPIANNNEEANAVNNGPPDIEDNGNNNNNNGNDQSLMAHAPSIQLPRL